MATKRTKTIKQTMFIPARPADIYTAFLDPKKHSQFTGSEATCDPRSGGKFTAWGGYILGKNLELTVNRRIVQEWKTTEWPEGYPPSLVEFSFREKGTGTELTMVQSRVPAAQADSYAKGWVDFYWNPLKEYFQGRSKQ